MPWWNQDSDGSPQKLGPCGDEDDNNNGGGGPTGAVTPLVAGQTVSLEWTEVISHTGWFRIALAADRSQFVDPPVQVDRSGNSADAGIEDSPVLPVLADGVYKHTIGGSKTWGPYSLTLPAGMTCAKCTIQIIQVMLDHPSNLGNLPDGAPNPDGFLYHHCIDVSISASDSGMSGGGGQDQSGADSGATPPASSSASGNVSGFSSGSASSTFSASSTARANATTVTYSAPVVSSSTTTVSGANASRAPTDETPASPSSSGCGCSLVGARARTWAGAGSAGLLALLPLARGRRRGKRRTAG